MNIRDHFKLQLESASPITLEQIAEMRSSRRSHLDDEQYEASIKHARLDTDELVGKRVLFYMLRTVDKQPEEGFGRSMKIEVLRIVDDEIDQLSGLKFDRMVNTVPIFESNE